MISDFHLDVSHNKQESLGIVHVHQAAWRRRVETNDPHGVAQSGKASRKYSSSSSSSNAVSNFIIFPLLRMKIMMRKK
jgi:hypothetical protein